MTGDPAQIILSASLEIIVTIGVTLAFMVKGNDALLIIDPTSIGLADVMEIL